MTIQPGMFLSYFPRKKDKLDNRHFDVVVIEAARIISGACASESASACGASVLIVSTTSRV